MAFDYDTLNLETVEPLIREFGRDLTLLVPQQDTGPDYDPGYGDPDEVAVRAVQTRFTKDTNQGTLVERGDKLFLVSTEGVTIDPALPDYMLDGSTKYKVIRIDPLKPGEVTMLWKVHARK